MKKAKSITLDEEVLHETEMRAKREDRTLSAMINFILRKYFKKE